MFRWGRLAVLEDEHELVLAAIEAALTGIVLHPDAHVLEVVKDRGAGGEQLADMPPVNEHEVDGAIDRVVERRGRACP